MKEQKEMIEYLSKSLTAQVQKEIKLATSMIKGSDFDVDDIHDASNPQS